MAGVDVGGVSLVAAVGVMGAGLLALGHRVRTLRRRVEWLARDAAAARREAADRANEAAAWAVGAHQALAAERRADEAVGRVDDLDEVRATIGAILDRAAAVRDGAGAAAA